MIVTESKINIPNKEWYALLFHKLLPHGIFATHMMDEGPHHRFGFIRYNLLYDGSNFLGGEIGPN